MSFIRSLYINRTLCEVLKEARKCCETNNYSYMPGLLEEIQSLGNKMESKLQDVKDLERVREDAKALIKQVREIRRDYGIDDD